MARERSTLQLNRGLMGSWPLGNVAGIVTPDLSRRNNGILVSGPALVPGRFGRAMSFSGSNYVQVADAPAINPALPFSVVLWLKYPSQGNTVVVDKNGNSGFSLQISANAGTDFLSMWVGGGGLGPETSAAWSGAWHHVVMVASATASKVYIDGKDNTRAITQASTPSYGSSTPLYMGSRAGSFGFTGSMQLVRVVNRGLSAAEAWQSYARQFPGINGSPVRRGNSVAASNIFRRTLSPLGTRFGSRQAG